MWFVCSIIMRKVVNTWSFYSKPCELVSKFWPTVVLIRSMLYDSVKDFYWDLETVVFALAQVSFLGECNNVTFFLFCGNLSISHFVKLDELGNFRWCLRACFNASCWYHVWPWRFAISEVLIALMISSIDGVRGAVDIKVI